MPEGTRLGTKFYPVSNGAGMQIGANGRYDVTDDTWIEAFWDYNFGPDKHIAEVQVGKTIKDKSRIMTLKLTEMRKAMSHENERNRRLRRT